MLTLPCKILAGKKVSFYVNDFNDKSETIEVVSKPARPTAKKVTLKSRVIKGKASPKAKITIKIGKVKAVVKAKANGAYKLKLNKKFRKQLKPNAKITIVSQVGKYKSVVKAVKVKKK